MGCQASTDSSTPGMKKKSDTSLGIIRLDYDYPPAPGDIDSEASFAYDVHYKVVPGLTFGMCQAGTLTPEVEKAFCDSIDYLVNEKKVSGISGDCGFMMWFQELARKHTKKPVFMSALAQLPAVTCAYAEHETIVVMTANGKTLEPMRDLIRDECGVDTQNKRFIIVGCEDVPGFEAVALGEKVDTKAVEPGMVTKALQVVKDHPDAACFLLECTELPPYADAIRHATGLPVFDAITNCDFFITAFRDNVRFGKQDWQHKWDGEQEGYNYGENLTSEEKAKLINKAE